MNFMVLFTIGYMDIILNVLGQLVSKGIGFELSDDVVRVDVDPVTIISELELPKGTKAFNGIIMYKGQRMKVVGQEHQAFAIRRNRPRSSNVAFLRYDTEKEELIVHFHGGSRYLYNVSSATFALIQTGAAVCRTEGSNNYGSWFVGKIPSVGAAVYEYLVSNNTPFIKL